MIPQAPFPGQRRQNSGRCFQKSAFPHAIRAQKPDLLPPADPQGQLQKRPVISQLQMFRLQHPLPARDLGMDLPGKQRKLLRIRWFRLLHPLQLLFLCTGKSRLGRLMLEPLNHRFQAGSLLLLPFPGLFLQNGIFPFLLPIAGIIPRITDQSPFFQLPDHFCRLIQEKPVMGNHHHRMFIPLQIFLQPLNRLHIQMIRRLIQQQDIRFLKQQADQGDPCLLPSREFLQPPFLIFPAKTKAGE